MNYAELLVPDFSLILLGYLVCRLTPLNRDIWQPVESLVYFLLFPVLLFQSIIKSPLDWHATSSLLGAGLALAAVAVGLSYSLPYWPWMRRHVDPHEHAAAAQVGFRFNSFIALAIMDRIAGAAGLQQVALLIGLCVPIFNVAAVWPMAHRAGRGLGRELLRNPLIIATLSALACNLLGLRIPHWLEPSATRIGASALALGLMAAGAGMELAHLGRNRALTVGMLSIRHLWLPLVAVLLTWAFGLDRLQSTVLLAFAALPTASTCYVLAARMGFNGPYVAGLVTLSTLLAMLSLPMALALWLPSLPWLQ